MHHTRGRIALGRPRLFCSSVAALVVAFSSTARGQSAPSPEAHGRPLAIEDFYRLKTVAGPALSPDGGWVAFTVTTRVEATNGETGEVWLVPSDGSRAAARVSPEGANAGTVRMMGFLQKQGSMTGSSRAIPLLRQQISMAFTFPMMVLKPGVLLTKGSHPVQKSMH